MIVVSNMHTGNIIIIMMGNVGPERCRARGHKMDGKKCHTKHKTRPFYPCQKHVKTLLTIQKLETRILNWVPNLILSNFD